MKRTKYPLQTARHIFIATVEERCLVKAISIVLCIFIKSEIHFSFSERNLSNCRGKDGQQILKQKRGITSYLA